MVGCEGLEPSMLQGAADLQSAGRPTGPYNPHLEEAARFQLALPVGTSVFKTDGLKHSPTLPNWRIVWDFNPRHLTVCSASNGVQ